MKTEDKVSARLEAYKRDPDYQAERLSILLTEEIVRLMETEGVSRSELATRMGVSKARVSALLGGAPNMTLRTLAAIAVALESEVSIGLREWSDVATGRGEGEGVTAAEPAIAWDEELTTARSGESARSRFGIVHPEEDGRESHTAA
jgi:transcriptional regulator with XRE-family HTH domain